MTPAHGNPAKNHHHSDQGIPKFSHYEQGLSNLSRSYYDEGQTAGSRPGLMLDYREVGATKGRATRPRRRKLSPPALLLALTSALLRTLVLFLVLRLVLALRFFLTRRLVLTLGLLLFWLFHHELSRLALDVA